MVNLKQLVFWPPTAYQQRGWKDWEGKTACLTVTETRCRWNYRFIQKAEKETTRGTVQSGGAAGNNIAFYTVTNGSRHLRRLLPQRPPFIIQ